MFEDSHLLVSVISINPFTPKSDKHINSPYDFNTLSSRQVMRINENYQLGDIVLI